MVKSQPERVFIVTNIISPAKTEILPEGGGPPKIPPRMKKKGPALPEKPPHMRAAPTVTLPSQQPPRDPLRPRNRQQGDLDREREVLVAVTSRGAVKERPAEKRQREPAKLLMPTKKDIDDRLSYPTTLLLRKSSSRPPPQPVLLIPRGMVPPLWGSSPVSYALWVQRDAPLSQKGSRREPPQVRDVVPAKNVPRSGSVTRSGSLTSQGSSSSDSGNETFPKSVLKKQKRQSNNSVKGSLNNRKIEQKKNVTFNAFATVQLMEE